MVEVVKPCTWHQGYTAVRFPPTEQIFISVDTSIGVPYIPIGEGYSSYLGILGGETRLLRLTTRQKNLTSLWGGSQLTTHMPTSSPQKSAFAHLKTSILLNQLAQIQQNLNKASCLSKSSPLSLGGVLEWRPPCPQKVV